MKAWLIMAVRDAALRLNADPQRPSTAQLRGTLVSGVCIRARQCGIAEKKLAFSLHRSHMKGSSGLTFCGIQGGLMAATRPTDPHAASERVGTGACRGQRLPFCRHDLNTTVVALPDWRRLTARETVTRMTTAFGAGTWRVLRPAATDVPKCTMAKGGPASAFAAFGPTQKRSYDAD
jgi:hypothetical protein